MTTIALALHIFGALVWVGGMFAIYVCLRPALAVLDQPPQRLALMRATLQKFFPWVWLSIALLLASGYWMLFTVQGGFALAGLHVHIMQGLAWIMILLFGWMYRGAWADFRAAVDSADWKQAAGDLNRIRQVIAVNLPLGLAVVAIGATGRWWV
ncbi:MAG: CopD family protein [Chloroflexi bacterium]|nr:CopD family protein [Chloroflexota bacterium]